MARVTAGFAASAQGAPDVSPRQGSMNGGDEGAATVKRAHVIAAVMFVVLVVLHAKSD